MCYGVIYQEHIGVFIVKRKFKTQPCKQNMCGVLKVFFYEITQIISDKSVCVSSKPCHSQHGAQPSNCYHCCCNLQWSIAFGQDSCWWSQGVLVCLMNRLYSTFAMPLYYHDYVILQDKRKPDQGIFFILDNIYLWLTTHWTNELCQWGGWIYLFIWLPAYKKDWFSMELWEVHGDI